MTEIFEGVAGIELCAGEIALGHTGETLVVKCEPCTFTLDADDLVEVQVTAATELGPQRKLREAPWSELEDHPLVALVEEPPGGHVVAELRGVLVTADDRIWIAGAIDRGVATDGYRGSSDAVVRAIEARWIGVGKEGREWVEARAAEAVREKPPEEPRAEPPPPSMPSLAPAQVLAVLGVLGIFAALLLWGRNQLAPAVLGYALVFASLALFTWRRRRFLPRMLPPFGTDPLRPGEVKGPRSSFRLLWGLGGPGVPVTLFGGALMIAPTIMASVEDGRGSLFLFPIVLFVILVQLGFTAFQNRADARLLGVVANAKPASGEGWGLRDGEVVGGSLMRWRKHTREESTSTETYTDSDGRQQTRQVTNRWYHGVEYGGAGTLRVRIGEREIQVDVRDGALWATARRSIRGLRLDESVEPGDHVLILGRLEGNGMKLGGPESLLLFADPNDARVALKQARLHHRLALAAFALGAAACIALLVAAS